ncbi:hypothetical protein DYBT9623_00741 [Dyadobacter sp. CECT 9623]|uniref:Secretion system C-terminal sorting domain-containing protein n=1 Tax=Dyadobacter linearis TaxID=2823330 RepID=A0ABN7R949_9BACT|nr:T9SS type A sorting domain-containing protein [Dyadobacter sp. CECT 9623]CAG5068013.1 hypothetical protein DYBT9623_00741 [Dyadobacter sp. CECT 9623]
MHSTLLSSKSRSNFYFAFSRVAIYWLIFLFFIGTSSGVFASVFYVKTDGTGDGTVSWANANADLQAAIDAANAGDEIWVAAGSYTASVEQNYARAFQMKEGVRIYGGFAGTELTRAARDLASGNRSILYTLSNAGFIMHNTGGGLTNAAVLDGFALSGRNNSSLVVNENSSPIFVNVELAGPLVGGSTNMMYNSYSSPTLINCLFINRGGIGMANQNSSPILVNCTITKDPLQPTTGLFNGDNSSPQILNSIILGSQTGMVNPGSAIIRYSQVEGINDTDPTHHNISGGVEAYLVNHRLTACSPGINKGNNSYYSDGQIPALSEITKDLGGDKRFYKEGTVDLGAFEYQVDEQVTTVAGVWYVKPGGTGSGKSWDCALGNLQLAINAAYPGDEVWVSGGSYTGAVDQDNTRSFQMREGVRIYGGFAGTELSRGARDLSSGNTSNLYARSQAGLVMNNTGGLTNAAVLDGFTLTGLYNIVRNSSSSPTFVNVVIVGPGVGGGHIMMENNSSSPILINCLITNRGGTAILNNSSSPVLLNATINSVSSLPTTGMVNNGNSSPKIRNSIILGNQMGMVNSAAADIRYSYVKGLNDTDPARHNLKGDEELYLVDSYRLSGCSPAINTGNNAFYDDIQIPALSEITKDLGGRERFYNDGIVDLGASEYQGNGPDAGIAGVWYVRQGGTGTGKSWGCPLGDLQLAINSASSGEHVWVAAGTYIPGSGPRFSMKEGVKIYGGFAGNETSLNQRDLSVTANISTLSGNNGPGVLIHFGLTLTSAAVLDGFTITGSNGAPAIQNGSGSSPMLANLTVTGNNFSGMYITDSSPVLVNCTFSGNTSNSPGGGMLIAGGSPRLINCLISNNTSNANGGGVFIDNATASMINCTIAGNTASGQGGGIFNQGNVSPLLYNSIVHGNNSGIYEVGSKLDVQFSLVQKDPVPGGPATANIDPLFVNAADGNYRLQPCSPAVNAGFNYFQEGQSPEISAITADLDRNPRLREHIVDLGAYEFGGASRELASDNDEASTDIARDYVLTSSDCQLIAYLNPGGVLNGTGAASGPVSAKVWVESTQPKDFVKRHYQITPSNNPAGASSKITLFFTQQEFDDFNAVNPTKLPLNAADTENNKANLRIEKRAGVSNDGSGLPNSYTGNISTFTPAQANGKIEWNADAQYWEVTFDVTGFSGFFVKTTQTALPLNLISFNATKEVGSNLLQWSTTNEVNTDNFEIQRSGDAKSFIKIATVDAAGSGDHHYSYHDQNNFEGNIYYRLKMSDRTANGLGEAFTYSKIISLNGNGQRNAIYPNPAGEIVTFQVSNALLRTWANLYDITGRHIQSLDITSNKQQLNIKSLPSGLYILKFADGTSERFVKK